MRATVLITGAGSGSANNLVRSLRAEMADLTIVGCHADRFILKKSSADRNYLVPASGQPGLAKALCDVIATERIDLLIPTSDADVKAVSILRDKLPCRLFMPSHNAIELCQDKLRLSNVLRQHGVPAPETIGVRDLDGIEEVFQRFTSTRLWCRIRIGSGSTGALPVTTPEQARAWISYWHEMRGIPVDWFTLSTYLPGRDFACPSLWREGRLVVAKTAERLSYFGGATRASGVSSTPALAKTVYEPDVVGVCADAIRAVDPAASGVFSVDLKQDAAGRPCVTEINVGRFFMITNLFDLTGKHNMAATYVRLALGESVDLCDQYDVAEDYYLVRDLDALPGLFHAEELFEGLAGDS